MRWVALLFAVGCGAASPPVAHAPGQRLEIAEGTPVTLVDGTTVGVTDVRYTRTDDQKELSSCVLVVRRGEAQAEVPLAREHGGSDPESAGSALGWSFALEVADPYRRPKRVVVEARRR